MRRARARPLGAAVSIMMLVGLLGMHLAAAQTGPSQADAASLQALVQAAVSSRSYAQGLVTLASGRGLDTSSATAFLASGNASLAAAQAALSGRGNLTAGLGDAHAAMKSFTEAAASASVSLQNANLASSAEVGADSDAIGAVNRSALQVLAVIGQTCTEAFVNSTVQIQFQKDCESAKASVSSSAAELKAAAALVAGVESGQTGAGLAGFANLMAQARADLASASAELGTISSFTYSSRGEAFVSGPMAGQSAAANASVKSQGALVSGFKSDVSSYQAFSSSRSSAADGINSSAAAVARAISSVSMTAVTTSISAQQTTLATTLSNLTSLSQQVAALPLPALTISSLQANITAAETSLTTYDSALSSSGSLAGSFPEVTIDGFSAYFASFDSGSTTAQTDGAAFIASLASLQTQLGVVAGEFPLLPSLAQWQVALGSLGKSVSAGSASVNASLQGSAGALTTLNSDITSLTAQVQGASKAEVSASLLQDVSSTYLSENLFLNATALAALQAASTSLQTDAQLASSFAASSQSLLQQSLGQFGSASRSIGQQDASLKSQAQTTLSAMALASTHLAEDLSARTQALASAESLISQALDAFEARQVAQGASLMAQASLQLRAAYSRG